MIIQKIHNLTDEQLVAQFQASNDNLFFGEIYNRYYKKVYHTCLGIVKDRDLACDLVQDIMIKVMENLHALQNSFLLGLWIHRIAKNYCIDFAKNRHHLSMISSDDCFDIAAEGSGTEETDAKEILLKNVERVMLALREDDRTLLTLKYFDNYTVIDLQQKYSLSESAVKMRLARARKSMADLYFNIQQEELCA